MTRAATGELFCSRPTEPFHDVVALRDRSKARWHAAKQGVERLFDASMSSQYTSTVKTITIQQLHEHTQDYVRAAEQEPIAIADQGRQVAVLSSLRGADMPGKTFPVRDVNSLPKVAVETSNYISEDRNGR